MNCWRLGCKNEARWYPVLLMTPDQVHCARGELRELVMCDTCKKTTVAQDLISDEGWRQMVSALMVLRRAAPSREWSKVEWVKLGQQG